MVYVWPSICFSSKKDIREILHSDEVLALKTRLLLKTLWLISFLLLFNITERAAFRTCSDRIALLHSTRGSNLGVISQIVPTARHARYSTNGIIDSGAELLVSSLWEFFTDLGGS